MGNIVINDALGRIAEKVADGADLILIPLSAVDTDANLKDAYAGGSNVDDILGDAANTERTTGGWVRKVILNASLTLTVDDSDDHVEVIIPDTTFTGPTTGNNVVALLIAEDAATDTLRNGLTSHVFVVTTDGNDVTADFSDAAGFWSSS